MEGGTVMQWSVTQDFWLFQAPRPCLIQDLPAQVLVPPLRELEGYVFEQLLRQLWRNVLLEATFDDTLAGASAAKPILPSKHRQATREEQAVQRWLQALQVCTAKADLCAGRMFSLSEAEHATLIPIDDCCSKSQSHEQCSAGRTEGAAPGS